MTTATCSYEVESLGNGEFEIKMIADLAEGYHTYSQFMEVGAGPYPTWLQFDENENIEIGEASEEGFYTEYDPVWEMDVTQFADQAIFVQKVKVTGELPQTLSGKITYQTCDAEKCVLFDEFFEVDLK
ncbi:protein-disulfide reductase DsbD domain-containing protein [Parvicella tangerina]|uniref:Thiol:disulfide interchange protein DsbD N-terminal domain-containing protein n=1 Tax=Parvicella tangerina TaxID=2829795 RepID=A0A916JKA6_9FLAO|nr:protein-disulfide reductase DsbD domain-containing protein [Parvicella tangerina]CAG5076522.1 hypothetical protein CRYO30217_00128 [Parvicella tangerina]